MAEEYFGKSLDIIKRAIAAHELQGYEDRGPYIFTNVSKKEVGESSSAFGPGQITGKTIKDLMARYPKQFTGEFKNYALSMINQGGNKLNLDYYEVLYKDGKPVETNDNDKIIFGPLGEGNISKEMHDKNYDKLWTLTIKDKAKAAKDFNEFLQNYHGDAKNPENNIKYAHLVQEKFKLLEKLSPLGIEIPDANPFTTNEDIPLPKARPKRNLEQTIDQEGPITDTGEYIPVPEDMKPTLEDRVIEVPEEKNMYQRIKPYIPVLRHLNQGGAIPMKKQMEMFDEGGLSTDEEFNEDLEGTFEITPEIQKSITNFDLLSEEEQEAIRKKLIADAMERMLSKSSKKIDRSKFIKQYNEGGLEQDGGMIDPVSGNDVPPGSSQEEVRDDIPAQLSEGEFVFPADVVRYIGLEKLMQMRQEAKMGLKMMDEMGQMGNSEEATMPDDLPFDINDLDMDDEIDDNIQNFNVGGMPMPNQQAGVFFTPGTSGIATSPVQAASTQYQPDIAEPVRPQQAPVPTYQPREIPEYTPFIGGGAPNVEQETRQFINDEGNIINVIYNKATGEPLNEAEKAKIIEGYRPYDPNAPKVEDTTVTPTQVQTATVTGEGGRSPEEKEAEEEARRRSKQRIKDSRNLFGLETVEGVLEGMGGTFGTYGPESVGKMTGTGYIIGKNGQLLDPSTGLLVRGGDTGITSPFALIAGITDPRYQNQKPFNADFMNALPDNVKGRFVDNLRNNPAYFSERFKNTTSIAEVRDAIQKADDFEKDFKDKGFVINSDGSFTAKPNASDAEKAAAAAAVAAYAESMSTDDDEDDDGTFNRLVRESMAAKARRERGMERPLEKNAAKRRAQEAAEQKAFEDSLKSVNVEAEAAVYRDQGIPSPQAKPQDYSGFSPGRSDPGRGGGGAPSGPGSADVGGQNRGFRAKGGLMEAPKPKAKKKMKRGGLASKK